MKKIIYFLMSVICCLTLTSFSAEAQDKQTVRDLSINISTVIASGFTQPVQVTHANDSSQRLFVVEQVGRVKIIHPDHSVTTFLDIDPRVLSGGERGLLGIAFHPSFSNNGYFYLNYINNDGNTTISRFQVSSNPDIANPNSELILFTIQQPYSNHNGGQLLFGPDGYLYIGTGDGGSGGDPLNNAQNLSSPLGKILRIDVNSGSLYAIPDSNPFINTPGADPRIWAWGLRNPWRFSFDRTSGDLFIGDVGQNLWEEVDLIPASDPGGMNLGWRCMEGNHTYSTAPPCDSSSYLATLTAPITEYSHDVGRSITGGFMYRGSLNPGLFGVYFFADYVEGKIFSLQKDNNLWVQTMELDTGYLISGFGEDQNGEIYVIDYNGTIRQLRGESLAPPSLETSQIIVDKLQADPNEILTYTTTLNNTGVAVNSEIFWTDPLPEKLTYIPNSLSASSGTVNDNDPTHLTWHGLIAQQSNITIQFQARINNNADGSIVNLISITGPEIPSVQKHAVTSVPRPVITSTKNDFYFPGTQPGNLNQALIDSIDCQTCHNDVIYDLWRGSMMSQAGRDPLTWAAIYNANAYVPNSGEYCLRCHTPNGWYEGRSQPANGSALEDQDIRNGVSCQLCHRMVDIVESNSDEASTIDAQIRNDLDMIPPSDHRASGAIILDPEDRRRGPFNLADTFTYHAAYQTEFLGQRLNAWKESSLCGSCHNVDNPLLSWDEVRGEFWLNEMDTAAPDFSNGALFPIERTFDEWAASDFADQGVVSSVFAGDLPDQTVRSCQDCHMPRTSGTAALDAFNPTYRDCQTGDCIGIHSFYGANTWVPQLILDPDWRLPATLDSALLEKTIWKSGSFLRNSATLTVELVEDALGKTALVTVTNLTGHKLPTGYPEGRRMWIEITAKDASGNIVYQSGKYDWNTHQLIEDPDIKIYEAKQGVSEDLAQEINMGSGASFHFVLNNTIIKDNRIPPQGVTQAEYDMDGLRPVGAEYASNQNWDTTSYALPGNTESVMVKLYYQVASDQYIDFLENYGGYDGYLLKSLWDKNPSDPFLVKIVFSPQFDIRLPLVFKNQ